MAGRNQKTNFDFFRLDTGFFSNKKIKALRRQFGSIGVLTYLYILSYAYGNDGYYIKIDSVEDFSYDIAESIANSNLTQVASVAADCINYLASRGEINKHLLDKGVISGDSIQRQYIEMCKASKRRVELKEEYRLVDTLEYPMEEMPISSEEKPISSEEIPISSEEMRQNKIKGNIKEKDYSVCNDNKKKDTEKEKREALPYFRKPTLEEVTEYCNQRLNRVNPQAFMDYYQSVGWKVGGKAPMKDWKAAVRTWEQKEKAAPRREQESLIDRAKRFVAMYEAEEAEEENGGT